MAIQPNPLPPIPPPSRDPAAMLACVQGLWQHVSNLDTVYLAIAQARAKEYTDKLAPAGSIIPWGSDILPDGPFVWARGDVVSIAQYPSLYKVYGTSFNAGGEAAGTFRLPDAKGNFLRGKNADAVGAEGGAATHTHEMPTHAHTVDSHSHPSGSLVARIWVNDTNGRIYMRQASASYSSNQAWAPGGAALTDAAQTQGADMEGTTGNTSPGTDSIDPGDTLAGSSLPPYLVVNFIIRY